MGDINVISSVSCSGTLIYIINFQFQPNLRRSNFRPQYWDFETSNGRQGPKFYARVLQMVSFFSFHHFKKQQPPAFLFLKLFQNLTYSTGQMGHCCKKDFKSHKFSVINVFNKHADIIFSSCHYDDDEEEKPPFFLLAFKSLGKNTIF